MVTSILHVPHGMCGNKASRWKPSASRTQRGVLSQLTDSLTPPKCAEGGLVDGRSFPKSSRSRSLMRVRADAISVWNHMRSATYKWITASPTRSPEMSCPMKDGRPTSCYCAVHAIEQSPGHVSTVQIGRKSYRHFVSHAIGQGLRPMAILPCEP